MIKNYFIKVKISLKYLFMKIILQKLKILKNKMIVIKINLIINMIVIKVKNLIIYIKDNKYLTLKKNFWK